MKSFDVPSRFQSAFIAQLKAIRKKNDPRKRDFEPALLDFGPVRFLIPRHFGFCYGVENAIEIAYRTLDENPGKKVYFLGEMIHNPVVNQDLLAQGIRFLQDTKGKELLPIDELTPEDIVLIPAFGTSLQMKDRLDALGLSTKEYDTTCPFVVKVWNKAAQLSEKGFSVVVHGKPSHEETRATFSHAAHQSPTVVVKDMEQAGRLAQYISGELPAADFHEEFAGQFSEGFDLARDLVKFGVVNQTTMLASDTQAIARYLKSVLATKYGQENITEHFADTRDTLCYATNDNQSANIKMLESKADLAIVVGGYNSSNTSHLMELAEEKLPSYFIEGPECIHDDKSLTSFDLNSQIETTTRSFLPIRDSAQAPTDIVLTCGASCPDRLVEEVLLKLLQFFPESRNPEAVLAHYQESVETAVK